MSSNIVSVFNPPPSRDLSDSETGDCLPCQVMSTLFTVGFGGYLASGQAVKYDPKKDKMTLQQWERINPMWWKTTLRSVGVVMIGMGIVRGTEGWLWNPEKKYKSF